MVTPLVKTAIVNIDDADSVIQAVFTALTIAHVYAVSIMPVSNTKAKIYIVYD